MVKQIDIKLLTLINLYFQLIFEGIRGKSYHGDIALDDISVKEKLCTVKPVNAVPSLRKNKGNLLFVILYDIYVSH